jgi:hypothetical protein
MMKHLIILLCFVTLSLPVVSQTTSITTDYNLSAEYNKYNNLRKASLAGVAVFGATWIAGSVICVVEQNRYADDSWDGNDIMEYARLSNEAKEQKAYKRGQTMELIGFFGAGLSAIAMYKFGKKAKQIKNGQGNVVALLDMDLGPHGASLILTF